MKLTRETLVAQLREHPDAEVCIETKDGHYEVPHTTVQRYAEGRIVHFDVQVLDSACPVSFLITRCYVR